MLPVDGELNPNNPVVQEFRGQWDKIAAILMWKFRVNKVQITLEDIERFANDERFGHNIVLDNRGDDPERPLILRLVSDAEAVKLARQEGGLPV